MYTAVAEVAVLKTVLESVVKDTEATGKVTMYTHFFIF